MTAGLPGPPSSVGLVFRPTKGASRGIHDVLRWLAERSKLFVFGDHPLSPRILARLGAIPEVEVPGPRDPHPPLIVSFGGDGTLLHALHSMGYRSASLFLGLNYGTLGFLTEGTVAEGVEILESIWKGRGWVDRRLLLDAELIRGGERIWRGSALNEIVIRQGRMSRPLKITVSIDSEVMATVQADGFMVATPTGSTAYALAAGGPIIHPAVPCLELTPIAPHSMASRSIVVHDKGTVGMILESTYHQGRFYGDGIELGDLVTGDRLLVRLSPRHVRFARVRQHHYYRTLRDKLTWHH